MAAKEVTQKNSKMNQSLFIRLFGCMGLVTGDNFYKQLGGNQLQCMLQDHLGSTWVIFWTFYYDSPPKICEHWNVNGFSSWRLLWTGCLWIARVIWPYGYCAVVSTFKSNTVSIVEGSLEILYIHYKLKCVN